MGIDDRPLTRRGFLAATVGSLAAGAAGCSVPAAGSASSPSSPGSPPAATPLAPSTSPASTGRLAHAQPRPAPVTTPASSGQITARAVVPVLCYHQIREWRGSDSAYNRQVLICPPKNFRAHLDALAGHGWTTISPDQYLAHLTTGAALPPKPVLLSFDDASKGQVTQAFPQLVKRGMTATFFVMTVVLDKPTWMSSRDVRRLAHAGMTIGAHTWDHHPVDGYHGRDWKVQVEQPRETLRRLSGQPVAHFAYPYGVVSSQAFPHLRAAGYRSAYQLEVGPVNRHAPLYTLRRTLTVSTWSGADLVHQLARHHG